MNPHSECSGLPTVWSSVQTETTFPVNYGTEVTVTCEAGYILDGSKTVTCTEDTEFLFQDKPTCHGPGKYKGFLDTLGHG